jgi:hypothetical protein
LRLQSDDNRFSRRAIDNIMATEGRRHAGRKSSEPWSQEDIDEELADIREEIENIALKMQQKSKSRWVYEWPMRKLKMN